MQNLSDIGSKIYRTDINGDIIFAIDDNIDVFVNDIYISNINFGFKQLAWCLIFIFTCYIIYFIAKDIYQIKLQNNTK